MDYHMPVAAKKHSAPASEYTYNRRPKGLYSTSRPYYNSGCSACLGIFLVILGAGLIALEVALIVLDGHMARKYVCGIWSGIIVLIEGALSISAAKSQKTPPIIANIAFSLLAIGTCVAVLVISYEAIDWDADDYGDGNGKRIARLACEGVRSLFALLCILMSFIMLVLGIKSMCCDDDEVIYHKFHNEYIRNSPIPPPHYIETKEEPLPEPEPQPLNEEPIRRKKQNEARAAPRDENPYVYDNPPPQPPNRWENYVKHEAARPSDYGPLPSANVSTKRKESVPNVNDPNTVYVPSNTGFVMVKSKASGSTSNLPAATTTAPVHALSTPNLGSIYSGDDKTLPAHYYEPSPATTVVGSLTKGTTVQTTGASQGVTSPEQPSSYASPTDYGAFD